MTFRPPSDRCSLNSKLALRPTPSTFSARSTHSFGACQRSASFEPPSPPFCPRSMLGAGRRRARPLLTERKRAPRERAVFSSHAVPVCYCFIHGRITKAPPACLHVCSAPRKDSLLALSLTRRAARHSRVPKMRPPGHEPRAHRAAHCGCVSGAGGKSDLIFPSHVLLHHCSHLCKELVRLGPVYKPVAVLVDVREFSRTVATAGHLAHL